MSVIEVCIGGRSCFLCECIHVSIFVMIYLHHENATILRILAKVKNYGR